MAGIKKLKVLLLMDKSYEVGELVLTGRKIYFQYFNEFLNTGLNLSPLKLPFTMEIASADQQPFEGLFGVFDDSLPDGWGRLLLDRHLSSQGVNLNTINPLDRLAFVGTKGKGALVYQPALEPLKDVRPMPELDLIASASRQILQGESSDVIEELFVMGGSSGGARPKIFTAYNPQTNHLIHGANNLPKGYEDWIIKFPSFTDNKEIANTEYAYHKMALAAGISMTECRLFEGDSEQAYFGTKRFDRISGKRLHTHTAAGIMHDNFRMSTMDYGHLMDCAFQLEKHVEAYEKIFRLAAFNVYAHNRDDHSKNFSFLMNVKGGWSCAPAYDLTFSSSGFGLHSTMVAGESKNPGRQDLMKLATYFSLKDAGKIIEEVQDAVGRWQEFAYDCGVSKQTTGIIQKALEKLRD